MNKNMAVEIAKIESQIQETDAIGDARFLKGKLDALHVVERYMSRYEETVELRTQYLRGVQHTLNDFFKEEAEPLVYEIKVKDEASKVFDALVNKLDMINDKLGRIDDDDFFKEEKNG